MAVLIHAVGRGNLKPFAMPDRFRTDVAYFKAVPGELGAPATLGPGEYWIPLAESQRILEEGCLSLVSPLDSQNATEVPLSDEQEDLLEWLIENQVEHIRMG